MRILKYIFLLLLLFLIGLTVFVTTQKGDYNITLSKVIKTPRTIVFNYINDFRNWENFSSWLQDDAKSQINFADKTIGNGASFSWISNDSGGNIQTIAVKENESIHQKMFFNDAESEVYWTFKDTLGATKVSWRSTGKMTAMMKIKAFFKGGITNFFCNAQEKSLSNLDKTLDYELNTFSIKVDGIVNRPKIFYLNQTINSYEDKVAKNVKIMIPKMVAFFEKNKMVMHGKPFVIYNKKTGTDIVNFSVGVPVKDSISIMTGSDISSGKIEITTAIKTILTGDYSHLKEAKNRAIAYLVKNNLKQNSGLPIIEVYSKTIRDSKQPSKWVTEIYVPIYPKALVTKPRAYQTSDSTASAKVVPTPEIPVNQ